MILVLQAVLNSAVSKAFQSVFVQTAVDHAVQKSVTELHGVDTVTRRNIDAPTSTVRLAKFNKHKIEKHFLENTKMEERLYKLAERVNETKVKYEDRIPKMKMDLVLSLSLLTEISSYNKTNPIGYSNSKPSDESDIRRFESSRREVRSRIHRSHLHHRSSTPPAHE